jgi:hypothetical protein
MSRAFVVDTAQKRADDRGTGARDRGSWPCHRHSPMLSASATGQRLVPVGEPVAPEKQRERRRGAKMQHHQKRQEG